MRTPAHETLTCQNLASWRQEQVMWGKTLFGVVHPQRLGAWRWETCLVRADGRDAGWVQLAQNHVLVERRRNCVFTFSPELSCSSPCRSRDQYFLMRLSRVRRDSVVLFTSKYERRRGDRAAKFRSGAFQRSNSCTRRGAFVSRASCFKVPTCCSERELAATATTRRRSPNIWSGVAQS